MLRYLINYAEDEDEGRLLKPIICQLLKLVQYVKNNTHYDEDKGKDKDVLVDCAVFALLNTIMCS